MQLTMLSEPATAVSIAINTLSNFAQLKFCAILFRGLGLWVNNFVVELWLRSR